METFQDIPQSIFNEIERYLLKQMAVEEATSFEQKITADDVLREQVHQTQLLMLAVQEASLETSLKEFHKGVAVNKTTHAIKRRWPKQWLFSAAAFIAVIVIGGWLWTTIFNKNDRLFSQYYKPDPGLITAMGTSDNYTFDRAMIDYKRGNYDAALKAWESLLVNKPDNDTLNYFVGSSYLAKDITEKAVTHLAKVSGMSNSYFANDANWYMGLALLKQGKKAEALTYIQKAEHENKEALLKQLKR